MAIRTTAFGYPKIGPNRELKKVVESYWAGEITKEQLYNEAEKIQIQRLTVLKNADLDLIPSNDFSLYDFILDISTMLGVVPKRFGESLDLDTYFAMARGSKTAIACEMTKWFDTNYHYIVPEFENDFKLLKNRPLESYKFAKEKLGIETKPVLVGPFTYIWLGKVPEKQEGKLLVHMVKANESPKFKDLVLSAAKVYNQILKELEANGVKTVQLDEPALVLDIDDNDVQILIEAYKILTDGLKEIEIFVHTYYESLSKYEKIVFELPVHGIGLDFTINEENFENLKKFGFPSDKKLIAGIVSGRDPWKIDFQKTVDFINDLLKFVNEDRLIISNSSPLFHLPVSVEPEKGHLDDKLIGLLSFANERLDELKTLKKIFNDGHPIPSQNLQALRDEFKDEEVRKRIAQIDEKKIGRKVPFAERYQKQISILGLPKFPTTTIGSFPQTKDVRKVRADFNAGKISKEEYEGFIKKQIEHVIDVQEKLGLDVLVHGEFERSDMVEFFGQKMKGFAFTKNGWVQSYGTRCVRPPIIYGDVSRPEPMTVKEITYAQSLTSKPVKGMLTGPVTILNWSFYRKDIPKKEIAYQIALALRDEVLDLEKAGIKVIQIDEPAFREGLPLKKAKQKEYLEWAVNAFKLTNEAVKPETQIQTHMCYSEFNEIIEYIYAMDSDVILIEASRSKGEILDAFEKFNYDHGIGPGVYDIHSPRVPPVEEMLEIAERSIKVIDKNLIWINPDCGLKTRNWEEVIPSLQNLVQVARIMRDKYAD
ncbi:methionine synthase (B12-independent) [Candidatus Kryptonium thompsonii]|uniref:5-methyltetrahydropteroyltriglutamate--homocysteine methyltransferase n=1 Tax=Candidatus Kryptonium thompsonii TaxID=1633631 RepID=A0A0P1M1A4_9BACT|nr:methionine synthase (B12-independent) [Candidatus Kryptonium thompsoni]CUS80102.1 methionine synthase (B12-independent) [Candidatus Kryptonium thompsoni]CUS87451.1 methionine synthase (B12-independent) [Candidatus Kryptonium thompsoni]CUS88028.1 methionine synthase (B12-independent) [Candidatus Kryptonium thompsoni]CUS88591.1 methionine synthase (B12-independent) [Candidatus Kryptonium thompsoni]